jgi:hypothetical protein
MTHFALNTALSKELWPVFFEHKILNTEFILSLTKAQLLLFVEVSMLGDGSGTAKDGYIGQSTEEQLWPMQLALTLLGRRTSTFQRNDGQWILNILTSTFINPQRAAYNAGPESMKIGGEEYVGVVWCVTTLNGNWLSRRGGSVCYTGNTYDL